MGRGTSRWGVLAAWLAAIACAPPGNALDDGLRPVSPEAPACPDGFLRSEAGAGCDAIVPESPCAPGTMPTIGSTVCQPVGTTHCADGFVPDPGGWGCVDGLPDAGCAGASRVAVGHAACVPIGDCSAPPPANATVFVDARFDGGQLDATHFAQLSQAVAAAPAGAVIFIDEGTYPDNLILTRSVSLVGRCAEKVRLEQSGAPSRPAVTVSAGTVELSGVTIANHFNGLWVKAGATANVHDAVVERNESLGLWAAGGTITLERSLVREGLADSRGLYGYGALASAGGHLTLRDCAFVANRDEGVAVQEPGSTGILDRVVVSGTLPQADGTTGLGVAASNAVTLDVARSVIVGNSEVGLYVDSIDGQGPTTVTVTDSVIRDTKTRAVGLVQGTYTEYFGRNAVVFGTATLTLRESTLRDAAGVSLVSAAGGAAILDHSVVAGTRPFPNGYATVCAAIEQQGALTATASAVLDCAGVGLQIYNAGSTVALERSLVTRVHQQGANVRNGAGVELSGPATVSLRASAVTACDGEAVLISPVPPTNETGGSLTVERSVLGFGTGYTDGSHGHGLDLGGGSASVLTETAVVHSREVAVIVRDPGTRATFVRAVVRDTAENGDGRFGRGLNVQAGAAAELDQCLVLRNRDVAVMVGEAGARATLFDSYVVATQPEKRSGRFGWGAGVLNGGALALVGGAITSAQVGLVVAGASATVAQGAFEANAVALHAQDGSAIQEVDALPATVGSTDVLVTHDTKFVGNAVRLGTGVLPLPAGMVP